MTTQEALARMDRAMKAMFILGLSGGIYAGTLMLENGVSKERVWAIGAVLNLVAVAYYWIPRLRNRKQITQ